MIRPLLLKAGKNKIKSRLILGKEDTEKNKTTATDVVLWANDSSSAALSREEQDKK